MTATRNAARRRKYAHKKALREIEALRSERLDLIAKAGDLAREVEQARTIAAQPTEEGDAAPRVAALEAKLSEKQDKIDELTRKLDTFEVKAAAEGDESPVGAGDAASLEADLDSARESTAALESAVRKVAQAAGLEPDADPSVVAEAVAALKGAAAAHEADGADEQVGAMRVNLASAQAETVGLKQRLAAQEAENEKLRERVTALKDELSREEARADAAEADRDRLAAGKALPDEDDGIAERRDDTSELEERLRRAEARAAELSRRLSDAEASHEKELQETLDGTFPKPKGIDFGSAVKDAAQKKGLFGKVREVTADGFLYRRSGAVLVVDAKGESVTLPGKWFDDEDEPASDLD